MVGDARWHVLDVARYYLSAALYPFQYAMMLPRDAARQFTGWLDTAARIRAENESLQRQRIELAQLATYASRLAEENSQLRRLLGVAQESSGPPNVLVELLYEARTQVDQRLIINKGANAGITAGMPVIDENGLVGQVVRAGPVTAEVALLTDRLVSVPVQVLRNGLRALAFADTSPGKLELRYVPVDANVVEGDVLVTSGLGGWYPPGVPVARVESVRPDPVSGYARIVARPLAGPDHYRHFLVLLTAGIDPEAIDPDFPADTVEPGASTGTQMPRDAAPTDAAPTEADTQTPPHAPPAGAVSATDPSAALNGAAPAGAAPVSTAPAGTAPADIAAPIHHAMARLGAGRASGEA